MNLQGSHEPSPPAWSFSPVWCFNEARSLREAALAYGRVGLPVFPVEPRGKAPLVPRGVYAATCDAATIERWWHRYPHANIGMPTGQPSGCWVLDVDPRHGGLESLDQLQRDALPGSPSPAGSLHATRIQLTGGGGAHLFYGLRHDLEVQFSNTTSFAGYPGLDLRVAGGYIVVAPSQHKSGECYRWQSDLPLLPFPTVLVERWRAHRQRLFAQPVSGLHTTFSRVTHGRENRETDPAYWLRCAVKYGLPGQRHNYALFLAYHLLDSVGLTPEEAEAYLVAYAQQVPQSADDPFSLEEALGCLASAARNRGWSVRW